MSGLLLRFAENSDWASRITGLFALLYIGLSRGTLPQTVINGKAYPRMGWGIATDDSTLLWFQRRDLR